MTGRRPLSELTKNWSAGRRAKVAAEARALELEAATLEQLRIALGVSQQDLARLLDVQQPAISKLERRSDMRVSTLRELVEALGGELKLAAKFKDRTVDLSRSLQSEAELVGQTRMCPTCAPISKPWAGGCVLSQNFRKAVFRLRIFRTLPNKQR